MDVAPMDALAGESRRKTRIQRWIRWGLGGLGGLAAGVAIACAKASTSRSTPAPEPAKPVFHLLALRGRGSGFFYGLSIVTCSGSNVYWTFGTAGSTAAPPDSVVYGDTPHGYLTKTGPLPLVPGCYNVYVSGGSAARFRVDANLRVTSLGSAGITP